jgi:type IV pilus biogenesis protein CpaD/CtpE
MNRFSTSVVRFFAVAAVAAGLLAGCADQSNVRSPNNAQDARARNDRLDRGGAR